MTRMTLFSLLKDYCVSIPSLQRNYVHGRDDEHAREVREHFVKSLDCCCKNGVEMNLDIVYGVIEEADNGVRTLVPIDGQQRLTTLWLSAVYAANQSTDARAAREILSMLSRFSFESRPLASTFCRWLTNGINHFKDSKCELDQAQNCWGEDPTVQAMITTLRLIHTTFRNSPDALLSVVEWRTHFEFSEVKGDAADLYVKINARGKQLTQWENFKGAFAKCLKDNFNENIENLSDKFYDVFCGVPDNAFFALFARLSDYVLRTRVSDAKPFIEDQHKNLSTLANSKVEANQIYVPVDEFCLGDIADQLVLPFLRMVQWTLDNSTASFKYWDKSTGDRDKSKGIARALFFPENADERDFSLFLYEYFSKYCTGAELRANEFRALRLVANILENVARQPKDESPSKHFNRIEVLKLFLRKRPGLYAADVELSSNPYVQCVEEIAKTVLYAERPECVALMQECEELMHGRIRIAILNAVGGKWGSQNEDGYSHLALNFKDRLDRIKVKLEAWNNNKDGRKDLLVELIQNMPWDVAWNSVVPVNLEDSTYRIIVSNDEFAPWLQRSLVDQAVDVKQWFDPQRSYGRGTYAVDWRESLCEFICRDKGFEGEEIASKNDCRRVRWHDSSYYLFTKTNNPKSFPIGDWRIGYYLGDKELYETLCKWCKPPTMQMNYSGEVVFEMDGCDGLYVHLWARGIAVEFVRDDQRSGIRLVEITRIRELGYEKFFENVSEMFKSKPDDLFQALQEGSFKTLFSDCAS